MPNDPRNIASARLERRLKVSVVVLSLLGTLLLAMGTDFQLPDLFQLPNRSEMDQQESNPQGLVLVLLAGATSLLITDIKRWVQIGGLVANVLALIAVGISVIQYRVFIPEIQLLAIANLLVYLQIILQFQKKTIRIFWQLVMLSLLQVVVACALNLGVMFGVLLAVYLVCVLRVLMLMYVLRETIRFSPPSIREAPRRQRAARTTPNASAGERWFGETVVGQLGGPAINRTIWRLIALTTVLTMVLTMVIFSLVPRYHQEAWQGFANPTVRVVGYSEQVTVGVLGPVVQNPEIIMRVQLIDPETDEPFAVAGRPLFRGAVLSDYDGRGVWKRGRRRRNRQTLDGTMAVGVSSDDDLVRQEIAMQPSEGDERDVMFSIYPPVGPSEGLPDRCVKYDRGRNQLFRTNHKSKSQYVIHTLGIRDRAMAPIVPTLSGDGKELDANSDIDIRRLTDLGPEIPKLRRLIALAERVDEESGLEKEDRVGRARALADHLSNSGEYTYTLQPAERDWDLDPIEDFLANTRRGHCEYYASALVLMLRSRGIPARMVIGFVGDEWNEFGSFYQVRQLHAHTWVEVFVPREQLPDESYYNSRHFAKGGWLTLDPTPEDTGDEATLAESDWFSEVRQLTDYVQLLWTAYVVDMTPRRQDQAVYGPIRERWETTLQSIDAMFPEEDEVAGETATSGGVWVDWAGVFVGIVGGGALLAVLIVVCRPLRSRLARVCRALLRRSPRESADRQPDVPFYRTLEKMLAREGIRRTASQTQREFAFAAGAQLADRPALGAVAGLPRQVADAFYQVRFGGRALDNTQAQAVEQALAELGRALRGSGRG